MPKIPPWPSRKHFFFLTYLFPSKNRMALKVNILCYLEINIIDSMVRVHMQCLGNTRNALSLIQRRNQRKTICSTPIWIALCKYLGPAALKNHNKAVSLPTPINKKSPRAQLQTQTDMGVFASDSKRFCGWCDFPKQWTILGKTPEADKAQTSLDGYGSCILETSGNVKTLQNPLGCLCKREVASELRSLENTILLAWMASGRFFSRVGCGGICVVW